MTTIKISEAKSVQFPMVNHATEIGWQQLTPEEAEGLRRGRGGMLFACFLEDKLREFNDWMTEDQARSVVETIEALPPTIDGNREVLRWIRGEKQWYDENEQRQRHVQAVDFQSPNANQLNVTWEWKVEPPARAKANRADVMFIVNGIPVAIVEHKNPKDRDALTKAVTQLRRYEKETPELISQAQLHNETHLIDYWYGVTWNVNRRMLFKWKHTHDEVYRAAIQAFFEPHDFLRTLKDWILFYVDAEGETAKTVMREHQRIAVDKIVERCIDPEKNRGLIWHTQGSGKTFTLLTAAKLILEDKARFQSATVILVVDRTELEGQLKGWVERLLGEMQGNDIPVRRANTRDDLQDIFDSDFRGLVVAMIHKFEAIKKNSSSRENIYVFIDEAHRSVAADLGSYLMAAVPKATIIGFTGTPVGSVQGKSGSFEIFGTQDRDGHLHKYSIIESIEDETTVPIKYMVAPSTMVMRAEDLDQQFFSLAEDEAVTDIDELNTVLQRAVGLRTFLGSDSRVRQVATFVADHFQENVDPLGYKAFLVAVDRQTCARYKRALDQLLPPEWSEVVYSSSPNDSVDRPDVYDLQVSDSREEQVRKAFPKADELPKILIVTDKLLTGFDAPVLQAMYLDKPMRDHVLLQALARVNRPYVDDEGVRKKVGLVVDFVGVLKELNKALRFDSDAVAGALEDLEVLLIDLLQKIPAAGSEYLQVNGESAADEQLESLVYGKFITPEAREKFYNDYREIEALWEIVSPAAELRDHIVTYKKLSNLYAAVRNAYSGETTFLADLEHKTKRLIEESATQEGLGRFTKVATFDVKTLEALRRDDGPPEEKVFNLLRGLNKEIEENPARAAVLQSIREKAYQVIQNLEERKITGLAALDEIEALVAEKAQARKQAEESGLSETAFSVFWVLKQDPALQAAQVDAVWAARQIEVELGKFPYWLQSSDERRRLRLGLYKPLLHLPAEERKELIERVMQVLERASD